MFVLRRRAARVVLCDPDWRIWLIHAKDPADPTVGEWWELPGGGIDPGESTADACRRELREELGITEARIGRVLWTQHSRFEFGGFRFDQQETIHLAGCAADVTVGPTARESLERQAFLGVRRWHPRDLAAEAVRTLPPRLAELMGPVVDGTAGDEPLDITDTAAWTW